ncbi:MAG: Gfo/Idh/MocA family oxidoreductase [Alphaproteobacteria bacterium]|nr:Gfo/Idh/MocA family oxidoreductase [Alphaproteobacteria bacterium]
MIRIAILSFAHYHANFWAEAFQAESDVAITAIWDDDAERGREAATRFGVPFVADLDTALAGCDAVAVCSETHAHVALIERAARAGRAVLCEKPLATDLAAAGRIAAAVAAGGIAFMQSFPKRFDPVSHALRRLVADGTLGRIGLVRIRHGHFYGLDPEFARRWYVDPARAGGGALLDEGVHAADFLCWTFGMPVGVIATASSSLGLAVEDQAIAVFDYADGMTAEIVTSFSFAAADISIEIYGTQGTALVSGVDLASRDISSGPFLRVYTRDQSTREWTNAELVPQFKRGRFHHQNAIAFAAALRTRQPPPVTLDDGVRALTLIVRAYEAIRTHSRIAI